MAECAGPLCLDTLSQLRELRCSNLSSEGLGWNDFALERTQFARGSSTPDKFYTRHIIGGVFAGGFRNDVSGPAGHRTVRYRAGEALLYPAGFPHRGYDADDTGQFVLYLEPQLINRLAGRPVELTPILKLEDRCVSDLTYQLTTEVENRGSRGRLFAESLATALGVHLVRHYAVFAAPAEALRGGLAQWRLRRAQEYIEAHLSSDLGLEELAQAAGLSVAHFRELFKQNTGLSPHQYVVRKRIELAQRLLREKRLTLLEIALTCGFSDQSHFTRIFRQITVTTPLRFRDNC